MIKYTTKIVASITGINIRILFTIYFHISCLLFHFFFLCIIICLDFIHQTRYRDQIVTDICKDLRSIKDCIMTLLCLSLI